MRADIHDGPEHTLQSEAGYIDARPYCRIDENLLHRTAGPYIRVTLGKARTEQNESGFPRATDLRAKRVGGLRRVASIEPAGGCRPCTKADIAPAAVKWSEHAAI